MIRRTKDSTGVRLDQARPADTVPPVTAAASQERMPWVGTAAALAASTFFAVNGTVSKLVLAIGRLGSARTGLVGMAEPVLAGLVAWVVLSEDLTAMQLAGAVVVLGGIVLAESARRRSTGAQGQLPEGVAP